MRQPLYNECDMKKLIGILFLMAVVASAYAQDDRHEVQFLTNKGRIRVVLYNETPQHRDNFLRLVREGYYDGVLFHRVINRFMIQTGDSATRNLQEGEPIPDLPEAYKVPAEIKYPQFFHKRGALAAAREGDNVNPERASSMSQFYIVYGRIFSDAKLDRVQERVSKATNDTVVFTPEIRNVYKTIGGTPHLDGQYTVFGEVIEGMDVVEDIEFVKTDSTDRPIEDVRIINAKVVK